MKVTAIVEKGSDGLYSIYSEQEIIIIALVGMAKALKLQRLILC